MKGQRNKANLGVYGMRSCEEIMDGHGDEMIGVRQAKGRGDGWDECERRESSEMAKECFEEKVEVGVKEEREMLGGVVWLVAAVVVSIRDGGR